MLEKKIAEELNLSLKSGDKLKLSVCRMIMSEIKNRKIEERTKDHLSDDLTISVIRKMVKQHLESIDQFEKGGRSDLADKEKQELVILEGYLPAQMPEGEVLVVVEDVVRSTGASSVKDMGRVIKEVMARTQGRADGKTVSDMVRKRLN
ncbi:MAG: GatB/YqeY domain-containing protein [Candidatus Omnitrophica bacterium]|nr:GatB/YqeY domain-containing protein [Candidatus Omnitrophota bacterium]MDD5487976.1 GatB/YqeY domain-containing protein [Candidatus Omnitrophota bacterium]